MLALMFGMLAAVAVAVVLLECCRKPFSKAQKRKRTVGNVKYDESKHSDSYDAGYRVAVFEAHQVVGGGTHCFAVDGKTKWKFDSGLHYTVPYSQELLQLACGSKHAPVKISRMGDAKGVYDRVQLSDFDVEQLNIVDDVTLVKELKRRFPKLEKRIDRYVKICQSVLLRFVLWSASVALPHWIRMKFLNSPVMSIWNKWAAKTAQEGLDELFPGKDSDTEQLKALLCGLWIDAGCPPSRMSFFMQAATSMGFPNQGGSYPDGGPEEMNLTCVEAIESCGGKVFIKSPVQRIIVRDGCATGVELGNHKFAKDDDGEGPVVRAKIVISATGYRQTTTTLLPEKVTVEFGMSPVDRLNVPQSDGFVMANIAINGNANELGIECNNLWIQPSNKATGYSIFKGIDNFFESPLTVPVHDIPALITFPSIKDRKWSEAHPHHETCQVLICTKWDWFKKHMDAHPWAKNAPPHVERRNQQVYDELKEQWRARCLEILLHHYPQLKGKIEFTDISTPLTIEHYLPSSSGGAIGLDVTPARFIDKEVMRKLDMKTPIKNLWLTGQDPYMCGVPLVQASGIFTACRIMGVVKSIRFLVRAAVIFVPEFLKGNMSFQQFRPGAAGTADKAKPKSQ